MSTANENHEAQRVYWDGAGGDKWIKRSADVDVNAAPAQAAAIEMADIRDGMRVLDIGCGCGASTLALAECVGPSGRVLGIDLSHAMIAEARRVSRGIRQVEFRAADAARDDFSEARFDRMFSRFGVMFFGDPAAAFAHLRGALAPDGRLTFVCWRPLPENPWMLTPLSAVCKHVPRPARPGPEDPGPFSFGDPARVTRILTQAGFAAPTFTQFDFDMDLALGRGLEAAVETASNLGAASAALTDQPPELRAAAVAELRNELAPLERDGRVVLGAAVWIVDVARG
ncbi:MAG: methyltransferase domain-containing protein [Rhodoblastus sp.]